MNQGILPVTVEWLHLLLSTCAWCDISTLVTYQAHTQEHKAIQEGIKENGEEDTDKVIKAVMANRHAQVRFKILLCLNEVTKSLKKNLREELSR